MAPAWDELEEYYAGQKKVVVGDVDCTTDRNKKLCEEHEVKSYPTIKIYTPETGTEGENYDGAPTRWQLVLSRRAQHPPVFLMALRVMRRAGGRDLEAMLAFSEEKLGPYCSGTAMHVCTRPQKKILKKFMKMSEEERESLIAESDDAIAAIEAKAKEEGDAIQAEIKQLTDEHTVRLPKRMHVCCRLVGPLPR